MRLTLQWNGASSELLNANSQRAQRAAAQIRQETKFSFGQENHWSHSSCSCRCMIYINVNMACVCELQLWMCKIYINVNLTSMWVSVAATWTVKISWARCVQWLHWFSAKSYNVMTQLIQKFYEWQKMALSALQMLLLLGMIKTHWSRW